MVQQNQIVKDFPLRVLFTDFVFISYISVSPIPIRSPPQSTYTPANVIHQMYHESGIHKNRFDSPQSDSLSYPLPAATYVLRQEEPTRIEETWFKPIQRDRSQDSLLQSSSSRSNLRTSSAGPRTMEVTSLSPQSQVTFGKYTPNEIIAIVRVPELSHDTTMKTGPLSSTMRHGTSEPELNVRAKQEEEQQRRSNLHYERVYAANYRPPIMTPNSQQRSSRSRTSTLNMRRKFFYFSYMIYFHFQTNIIASSKFRLVFYFFLLPSYWVPAK